jgi:putative transposase
MARQVRIEFAGALYHVIARGFERRDLFRDDRDRKKYLSLLAERVPRFGVRVYAYCLMSNHVHVAIQTGSQPLSRLMKSLQTSYAQYFNLRHRRVGSLFAGRYKAFVVDEERYFLTLLRYIHLNPVQAGLCGRPEEYRWSSHRSYLGNAEEWLAVRAGLAHFGSRRAVALNNYRAYFAQEESAQPYEEAEHQGQVLIGDDDFAAEVLSRFAPELKRRSLGAHRIAREVAAELRITVEDLKGPRRSAKPALGRGMCAYLGRELAGISLAATGRHLGRERSTISRDVRRLEERIVKDGRVAATLRRIGRNLLR